MANYNKVILLGNLTRDPQLSFLPSQTPVCEFGLAVNRRWRGQDGQQKEDTCFIDCRCYGKQAETFNQYMNKGKPVLVEGRLQLDTWEGKDGQKRSKHRVFVERFQFIGSGGGSEGRQQRSPEAQSRSGQGSSPNESYGQTPPSQPAQQQPPSAYDEQGNDEIPF